MIRLTGWWVGGLGILRLRTITFLLYLIPQRPINKRSPLGNGENGARGRHGPPSVYGAHKGAWEFLSNRKSFVWESQEGGWGGGGAESALHTAQCFHGNDSLLVKARLYTRTHSTSKRKKKGINLKPLNRDHTTLNNREVLSPLSFLESS